MGDEPTDTEDHIQSIQRDLETLLRLHSRRRPRHPERAAESGGQLSKSCFELLRILSDTNLVPMGRLAELAGTDRTATTRTVDKLHTNGYVRRTSSRNDRRLILLSITPRGLRAYEGVAAVVRERLSITFAQWTDQDVAQFARLLSAFVDGAANSELRPARQLV